MSKPTDQPDKIEKECLCGRCTFKATAVSATGDICAWWWDDAVFAEELLGVVRTDYCPVCGYHLTADGFAHRMVQADRTAELEALLYERDRILADIKISHPHLVPDSIIRTVEEPPLD